MDRPPPKPVGDVTTVTMLTAGVMTLVDMWNRNHGGLPCPHGVLSRHPHQKGGTGSGVDDDSMWQCRHGLPNLRNALQLALPICQAMRHRCCKGWPGRGRCLDDILLTLQQSPTHLGQWSPPSHRGDATPVPGARHRCLGVELVMLQRYNRHVALCERRRARDCLLVHRQAS